MLSGPISPPPLPLSFLLLIQCGLETRPFRCLLSTIYCTNQPRGKHVLSGLFFLSASDHWRQRSAKGADTLALNLPESRSTRVHRGWGWKGGGAGKLVHYHPLSLFLPESAPSLQPSERGCITEVVASSSLAWIMGECSTIHSPPALFFFFKSGD